MDVAESWNIAMEGYMSSPVVIGKHAYMHLRNQRVSCVNLETGKTTWTTTKTYGKYWSMVANGDKILALDERGILYLLKANPEKFELLDEKKVSDQECWGHLAIVGDEVFIRELQGVSAWKWKK
jgi:outer membrane protein assembly factor BamB